MDMNLCASGRHMMTQTPREAPIYLLDSVIKEVKEEKHGDWK